MWIERLVALRHSPTSAWLAVSYAIIIAFAFRYVIPINLVFATFYPAVIISALVAGRSGAAVCTLITAVLAWYFFMKPVHSFELHSFSNALDILFYVIISTICAELAEAAAQALERAQDTAARNANLVREMTHRQNNQFAVVSAMLRVGAKHSRTAEDLADQMSHRLQALSRASAIESDARDIFALIDQQFAHLERRDQLRTSGPNLILSEKEALYLGMAFHELATNCLKHGAWSNQQGEVYIQWARQEGHLEVSWVENASRPIPTSVSKRGFGSEVLERIVPAALRGTATVELLPEGLVWRCSFQYEADLATDQVSDAASVTASSGQLSG